ncbi:MAG: hypothetical protein WEE64_12245 [Dehalococcoidia bacterium]
MVGALRASHTWSLAVAIALGALALGHRPGEAASGGPDISLAIDADGGGDDCDTRSGTSTGATCAIDLGEQFVVKGNVDSAAGLPDIDGDTQMGYAGFQFRLQHTPGLTLNNPPGTDTELGFPGPFWPVCGNGRGDALSGQTYDIVCFSSGAESLFLGKVVEVTYECSAPGPQTVTMDDAGSYIHNDGHGNLPLDKEGNELLTINCGTTSAVGGIAGPAAAMLAAQDQGAASSRGTSGITGGGAAPRGAVLAAGAFGCALWLARRRARSTDPKLGRRQS